MCWCNPNLRTPCCGKIDCIPKEELSSPRDMRGVIIEEGDTIAYGKSSRYDPISIGEVISISDDNIVFVKGVNNSKGGYISYSERIIVLPSYYKEKVVE